VGTSVTGNAAKTYSIAQDIAQLQIIWEVGEGAVFGADERDESRIAAAALLLRPGRFGSVVGFVLAAGR
jgi:hypothetical protein